MPDTMMQSEMFRNRSAETAKIAAALAAAQKAFAPIAKDREVTVRTKTGASYKFKYATLGAILSATMPALSEQGLAITQAMRERGTNAWSIETTLYHASGEWISNVTPMIVQGREGSSPGNQELGSAQSYARRYGISALLCLTADEDDDGNTADGGHIEHSEDRPRQSSANGRRMAADDPHLVDNDRAKGELAGKAPNGNGKGKADAAEKTKRWIDAAIQTLNLTDHTVDRLSRFRSDNNDKLAWVAEHFPDEYRRFDAAYDNAAQSARAKISA